MHDLPNRSARMSMVRTRIVRLDVRTFFGAQIVSVVCGINLHLHTETGGARFFCISIINPNANHFTLYLMVTKSASNLISNLAKHDFNLLCLRVITHEHLTIAIAFFHIYWVVTLIMQSRIAINGRHYDRQSEGLIL